ncbi:hypothetical protein K504DRAFT_462570 [Pleomassaria siparia CBS 279.74]|uniref:Uncharacterized protein n=1 Tax=Pleomassaria siparia CBS 279.74 TaxID=1314801 RepID=A0A6G1KML6_9PLEO|nr:hypothetical protein K504DRAFT_462570 [Pleomassaria siparia CBS 279.74]
MQQQQQQQQQQCSTSTSSSSSSSVYIYIIGEWESLEHHYRWIESDANKAVLESVRGELVLQLFMHIDVAHAALALPGRTREGGDGDGDGEMEMETVYSIVRYMVKDGRKCDFATAWERYKKKKEEEEELEGFATEGRRRGGRMSLSSGALGRRRLWNSTLLLLLLFLLRWSMAKNMPRYAIVSTLLMSSM